MKMNGGWRWILDFFYTCMMMKILCVFKWRAGLSVWRTRCCLLCGGGFVCFEGGNGHDE